MGDQIFVSSCRINMFKRIEVWRGTEDGNFYYFIYDEEFDTENPVEEITLCKQQSVAMAMAILADAIVYKGEVKQVV